MNTLYVYRDAHRISRSFLHRHSHRGRWIESIYQVQPSRLVLKVGLYPSLEQDTLIEWRLMYERGDIEKGDRINPLVRHLAKKKKKKNFKRINNL